MQINFNPVFRNTFLSFNKIKARNYQNINFTNKLDSFEKSPSNQVLAFFDDDSIDTYEKVKMAEASDAIKTGKEIREELGLEQRFWFKPECYEYAELNLNTKTQRRKTVKFFDMTSPINQENIGRIKEIKDTCIPLEEFKKKYGFSQEEYKRYVKEGLLEPVALKEKNSDKTKALPIINMGDKKNIDGVNRFRSLQVQRGTLYKRVVLAKKYDTVEANICDLAELGFGTPKELAQLIKSETVKGRIEIKEGPDGKRVGYGYINLNDKETRDVLMDVRNKRCVGLTSLANQSGISKKELEDCVLSGEMKGILEKTFAFDEDDILFDTKNPKNIETFDKLMFEKHAQEEAIAESAKIKAKARREYSSIRMKLIWQLCPQTKRIAKGIYGSDDTLRELGEEETRLQEMLEFSDLSDSDKEYFENKLKEVTISKNIRMKILSKILWQQSGLEEFRAASQEAKELMTRAKIEGTDSIQDENIKAILEEYLKLASNQAPVPFA